MGWVGSGWVGLGRVGSDDGNSDNRAKSVQLKLELVLSNICLSTDGVPCSETEKRGQEDC